MATFATILLPSSKNYGKIMMRKKWPIKSEIINKRSQLHARDTSSSTRQQVSLSLSYSHIYDVVLLSAVSKLQHSNYPPSSSSPSLKQ